MYKKRAFLLALIIMICLLVLSFFTESLVYRWYLDHQANQLKEEYIIIEDSLDNIINENFNILKGFIAYLKTNDMLVEDNTEAFIEELVSFDNGYLRNIGIIEDTTIKWNFPKDNNARAIGVDLAEIATQRDMVLEAKEHGRIVFHGPVDLVQGGLGFIMRIPFDRNSEYYGQVSVVFDGNKILHLLGELEKDHDISLKLENEYGILYTSDFEEHPYDLVQTFEDRIFKWDIRLQPIEGWEPHTVWYTLVPFTVIVFTVLLGYKSYTLFLTIENHKENATHDPLTGLYNRHYLYRYAEKVLNIATINQNCVGVMLININNFKYINDTYGHQVGNQVLTSFATKIKMSLRPGQEVFRIGGDEFILMFENAVDQKILQSISIRTKSSIEQYPIVDTHDFKITISTGTALFPMDGKTLDDLYSKADREMYLEKGHHDKV